MIYLYHCKYKSSSFYDTFLCSNHRRAYKFPMMKERKLGYQKWLRYSTTYILSNTRRFRRRACWIKRWKSCGWKKCGIISWRRRRFCSANLSIFMTPSSAAISVLLTGIFLGYGEKQNMLVAMGVMFIYQNIYQIGNTCRRTGRIGRWIERRRQCRVEGWRCRYRVEGRRR